VNADQADDPNLQRARDTEDDGWSLPVRSEGGRRADESDASRGAHAIRAPEDHQRSAAAASQQVLAEQLQQLAQALVAEYGYLSHENMQILIRMVRFAQELRELHPTDRKGRCHLCRPRTHWWHRRQPCEIHARLVDVFRGW
jgi:hypothetical protein